MMKKMLYTMFLLLTSIKYTYFVCLLYFLSDNDNNYLKNEPFCSIFPKTLKGLKMTNKE